MMMMMVMMILLKMMVTMMIVRAKLFIFFLSVSIFFINALIMDWILVIVFVFGASGHTPF